MKKILKNMLFVSFTFLLFTACSKDTDDDAEFSGDANASLSIEFDQIVDGQNLILDAVNYVNAAGETYTVSMLQYYVSNIKLTQTDGTEYVVPQDSSYFLIKEGNAEDRFATVSVPSGDYKYLSFVLGIDSLRNTMDISERTGVLDPSGDHDGASMYWGWNSGYIFLKMEGTSPQAPVDASGQHKYRFHIGGFGGYSSPTINNIKTIHIDLTAGGIAKPRADRKSNIHLMVDVAKIMNGSTTVSIAATPSVMFSDYSVNIADNYAAMFHHDHTEN